MAKKAPLGEHDDMLEELENKIRVYMPLADLSLIEKAYVVIEKQHKGQLRKSGEPFVIHPLEVAAMLAGMNMDLPSITAGLLHDVVEDTPYTQEDVEREFGTEVALLVDGVTKLKRLPTITKEQQQTENLRKMFMAMAKDIRVIFIKLVDRLHNMRTLQYMNTDTQYRKALETRDIYVPIAHRLGISSIKRELDDLCFKYIEPEEYNRLKEQVDAKMKQRDAYISKILDEIREKVLEHGIKAYFNGRPKHLASIKHKMDVQKKPLDQIYDLLAVRVIVDTVDECYMVLGILHNMYNPMPSRFKDYISVPKKNQYQSLHTTLVAPDGVAFEAQIRTWDMHKNAEIGIAAHWKYKENGNSLPTSSEMDDRIQWVRSIVDVLQEPGNSEEAIQTFKMDLFTDEVFAFTPKGEIKKLPMGSTPIDFAYAVHSDVGNRMVGARINGEIKPLNYRLQNGDFVEIITSASAARGPSRDWLNIVKSSSAKSKIRLWFKKERREDNIEYGRELVYKELQHSKYPFATLFDGEWLDAYIKRLNLKTLDDLLNVIGYGEISAQKAVVNLTSAYEAVAATKSSAELDREALDSIAQNKASNQTSDNGIIVDGVANCLVRFAKCCSPVPGDPIIGYITRGRGVSVHLAECSNAADLQNDEKQRMIGVRWASNAKKGGNHSASFVVNAIDRDGLVVNIAKAVCDLNINMTNFNARKTRDGYAVIDISADVKDRDQLDTLVSKISQVKDVLEIKRAGV